MVRPPLHYLVAGLLAASVGCAGLDDDEPSRCNGGKCDSADDTVREQLDGLDEVIADWLRASPMTDDGVLETDLPTALTRIAELSGCDISTLKTFVLSDDLVAGRPFPRLISTLCSDDETRAADFFIAASFLDPSNPFDVDVRNLEMFAWDKTQRRYVFYATLPVPGSDTEVQVQVEPRRCQQCHLNSRSLDDAHMPMLPIMNELTSPWPHWNAEPDFPSHTFVLDDETRTAPNFTLLTAGDRLGSAVQFEQIIRAAQTNRVIATRLRERRNRPADLDQTMALLRPLFCAEQINYVTEDHDSRVLPTASIIGGGTREAYLAISPTDWPWQWLNDGKLRFDDNSDDPLAMIPVRGNADVEFERRLIAVKAIDPIDVLRIRALDWQRPVLSELRCDLWKSATARLRENPPEIDPEMRNSDLIPVLYEQIMKLDGESLIAGDDQLIAIADGTQPQDRVTVGLIEFGDLLQAHADGTEGEGGRQRLREARDTRLCSVKTEFPNRPALPAFSCFSAPDFDVALELAAARSALADAFRPRPPAFGSNKSTHLIPDAAAGGVSSSIDIADEVPTDLVTVRVAIAHGWRGDIAIELSTPQGQTVEVHAFEPGDSADDIDTVFFVPELAPGTTGEGTWTLTVRDRKTGEQGFLEGWSIGINDVAPQLEAAGARLPQD